MDESLPAIYSLNVACQRRPHAEDARRDEPKRLLSPTKDRGPGLRPLKYGYLAGLLYGSRAAAGLIVAALGQVWLGLGFAIVGMAFDAWAQGRVKRYQRAEAPVSGWPPLLMTIVAVRFALGVSGPLIAWLLNPRVNVMLVGVLIQVWSIGAAFVSSARRLGFWRWRRRSSCWRRSCSSSRAGVTGPGWGCGSWRREWI